jgi:hypothetical protein
MSIHGNVLYHNGISRFFTVKMSSEAADVFRSMLMAEEYYATYILQRSDATLAAFNAAVENLKALYEALENKSELADFEEMYHFYTVVKYGEINSSAGET